MQDSSFDLSGPESSLQMCIRCTVSPVGLNQLGESLCEKCFSAYRGFRCQYGGNTRHSITVENFLNQRPIHTKSRESVSEIEPLPGFLVGSRVMQDLLEKVAKVAKSDIPVLIQGDTGTGKELVAQAIHTFSPRVSRPFVPVNCSTIQSDLAESELFGHERGSFTGAEQKTKGFFIEANHGTIFLDEVHDMLPRTQAKLLRVLEKGEVRSVGSAKTSNVNVRLITAANVDLYRLFKTSKFRQDLYFRLAGAILEVPTLEERKEEIPSLVKYILGQLSTEVFAVDSRVMDVFMEYKWPGNIRELRQVLWQATVFAEGDTIELGHLPRRITSVV